MKIIVEVRSRIYNLIENEIDFLNIKIAKCQITKDNFYVELLYKDTRNIHELARCIGKDLSLLKSTTSGADIFLPFSGNVPIKRAKGNPIIYGIYDPTSLKLKYVGRTNDFYGRKRQHLRSTRKDKISKWIRAKRKIGKIPYFKLLKSCSEANWLRAERDLIKKFKPPLNSLKGTRNPDERIKEMLMKAEYYIDEYYYSGNPKPFVHLPVSKYPQYVYGSKKGDYYIYYRNNKIYIPRSHKIYFMKVDEFETPTSDHIKLLYSKSLSASDFPI